MSRSLALTLCLALTAAGSAAALSPLFACADLPANWGNDSDENDNNNDNGPWADLSADPSSAVYAQIYSTFESRYSNAPLNAAWTPCATPEPSAVGCQQTAGQGMNYALQVNFTCPGTAGDEVTLGMTVDVNTYSQYINVDDMDVEFIAVNGEIVEGNIDESEWYEANDNIWGDWYTFNNNNNDNNNENENDNDSDDDNNNDNGYIGSQFAAIGQAAGSGQISGEQAGEMFREQGEAMG